MSNSTRRPPYDPEVAAGLAVMGAPTAVTTDSIPRMRAAAQTASEDLSVYDVDRRDITVPGFAGADLILSVYSPRNHIASGPGIFHIHGGGMIIGDRFTGMSLVLPYVLQFGAVATTIEYRLAPEYPDPIPVEDCYAALVWVFENAAELGIDAKRILIVGASAGGGLAAGAALLARDRGGPELLGQMLVCPMLDDRDMTLSTHQFDGVGLWDRQSNLAGWRALLGDRQGTDDVSIYAAPARATDLSGLPPAFIDVGSAEVFRDEDIGYASQIWADGGVAELHVWPGGTHAWEMLAPQSRMAHQSQEARDLWIARMLER